MKGSGDFGIGSPVWPGLGKLVEEMGEVAQVAGKLISTDGKPSYWDGTDLRGALCDELGDLQAAITFLSIENGLDSNRMQLRMEDKLTKFEHWHRATLAMIEALDR